MNPIIVLQNVVDSIKAGGDLKAAIDGIRDELSSIFSNKEITIADSLARGLEDCKPMSDHVDDLSLSVMHKAIKQSNYKLATNAIRSGTKRGYDSVNLYNKDKRVIAIYKKQENWEYNRFTTTCTLSKTEREYLFNSGGNFVTDNNLNNPEVFPILKNLTNKETEK